MPLGGKTLLGRVDISVRESNLAVTVMLTTDDPMIAAEGEVPWMVGAVRAAGRTGDGCRYHD
jgi:hypothetical protein